jgi:hypothetical protein
MNALIRFPEQHNNRRLPDSGSAHNDFIARMALLCNIRFSISIHFKWGIELARLDDLESISAMTPKNLDLRSPRPRPLRGENCTIVFTDVVAFGSPSRTDEDGRIIREALSKMTHMMVRGIAGVRSESRGDGILTVVPPTIPTANVIRRLLKELPPALVRHNSSHHDSAQFQLRAAVNVGPVAADALGVSGRAITITARLADAPLFKEAMDISKANFGLIASTFVYETAIRLDGNMTDYSQVQVNVKEFTETAWMKLFDEASPHSDPHPVAALSEIFLMLSGVT